MALDNMMLLKTAQQQDRRSDLVKLDPKIDLKRV